jgi:3-oxoacyl-[acyl-carrier protein] reductase
MTGSQGAETFRSGEIEAPLGIPDRMRELASQVIPLGRPATPEEAAGPIFFLCSPWSNFVHGQVITASGGQTTGMTS